jgi:hypothetical protein
MGGGGTAIARDCRDGDAGRERVIEHHLIARGAWGQVVGQEPIRLNEGDFIVFAQGDAHTLSSAPGMRATPDMSLFARLTTPLLLVYERAAAAPIDPDCLLLSRLRRTSIQPAARRPAESDSPFCRARRATGWLATLLNIAVRSRAMRGREAKTFSRVFLN